MLLGRRLRRNHYRAILLDPPWTFETWSKRGRGRSADRHYKIMSLAQLARLDLQSVAADDSVMFLWATWPHMQQALWLIRQWGWEYKTCAFCWTKVKNGKPTIGMGYWTRANTEPCLLATRGKPKRISAAVRQAIIEPAREHSRKPDCVRERIEALVDGPYLDIFSRANRRGWTCIGYEAGKFADDI